MASPAEYLKIVGSGDTLVEHSNASAEHQEPRGETERICDQPIAMPPSWPEPLHQDALLGLAGDVVRTIEPHTEADSSRDTPSVPGRCGQCRRS